MWMFYAIVGVVFFASLAMMVREGIWSNTITFVNIILCGLVAFGMYSPLTIMIDEALDGEFTYVLDFPVIWGVFTIAMIVSRVITDALSRTRLRLKHPLDPIGGPLVGAFAAFVMCGFAAATLLTAPLAGDAMDGKLNHTAAEVRTGSVFSSPDLYWLRRVEQFAAPDGFGRAGDARFEAAPFVEIYGKHREALQQAPSLKVNRS
jgi:hypothetical protein